MGPHPGTRLRFPGCLFRRRGCSLRRRGCLLRRRGCLLRRRGCLLRRRGCLLRRRGCLLRRRGCSLRRRGCLLRRRGCLLRRRGCSFRRRGCLFRRRGCSLCGGGNTPEAGGKPLPQDFPEQKFKGGSPEHGMVSRSRAIPRAGASRLKFLSGRNPAPGGSETAFRPEAQGVTVAELTNAPSLLPTTISGGALPSRSTAMTWVPTPDLSSMRWGTNSASPLLPPRFTSYQ